MVKRTDIPNPAPAALAIIAGPALIIEWMNERWYEMAARFTDDELVGHPITEYMPVAGSDVIERAYNYALDTGETAYLTGELVGPNGVMGIMANVYRLPDGKLLLAVWHTAPEPIADIDGPVGRVRLEEECPDRP